MVLFLSHKREVTPNSEKIGTPTLTVILPMAKREIPFGTFRSIPRQAILSEEKFK